MRTKPTLFRFSAALAIAGTAASAALPGTAWAQQATAVGDPPSRVGRVSQLLGTVSFHTADQQQWSPATLNYPVTSGDSFWIEPGATAQIEVGATHMALDQQTELDVDMLDNTQFAAVLPQGSSYLRVGAVNAGEAYTIRTPRGNVSIVAPGRYEIVAGDTDRPTSVTVVDGAAQVTGGPSGTVSVGPHQTATITGSDQFQGSVGSEADDPFLSAQLTADGVAPQAVLASTPVPPTPLAAGASPPPVVQPVPATYQPPAVVQEMTGASDLQSSGSWVETPQYGHVWYPPVEQGWVPYRHGHWSYVAPWGWTWVDDAPWGFAPYHYGRWVDVDDRWGWVPVAPEAPVDVQPVYSPALVDFVGIAAGVAVGAAIGVGVGLALGGGRSGNVGWVPLGYREPYIPPYGGSQGYINRINSPNFNRNTNIGTVIDQRRSFVNNGTINRNTTTINNYYANAAGATVVPAAVLQRGQPVAAVAHPVTRQQFAQIAQPRVAIPAPTAQTPGITPVVARQHNIPVAQIARPTPAPGPALQPRPAAPAGGTRSGLPVAAVAAAGVGAAGLAAAGMAANRASGKTGPAAPAPAAGVVHPGLPALAAPHGAVAPAAVRPIGAVPAIPSANTGHPASPGVNPNLNAAHPVGAPGPAITPHATIPGVPAARPALVPHVATPLAAPRPVGSVPPVAPHVAAPAAIAHSIPPLVPNAPVPQGTSSRLGSGRQGTPSNAVVPPVAPHVAAPVPLAHPTVPIAPRVAAQPAPRAVVPAAVATPHPVVPAVAPRPVPQPAPHPVAPPVVPRAVAPAPRAIVSPPPVMRAAPPPPVARAVPSAPAMRPAPPAPHRVCPPGHAAC